MKKVLKNILLLISPFAIFVLLVNYIVDPANIFNSGDYEEKIVNVLLKKHNAKGLVNFNERIAFEKTIKKLNAMPNTAVIGTSRVLVVQQKHFPLVSFRNLAMSHSTLSDIISQIGVFDSLNKFPQTLYIEIMPFLKGKIEGEEWLSLHAYHRYMAKKLNLKTVNTIDYPALYFAKRKANALISLDYFQTSLKKFNISAQKKVIDVVDTADMNAYGRYFDGSICYAKNYNQIDTLKVMADARLFIKNEGYPEMDERKTLIMQQLIKHCQSKNVKVVLLMMPFQIDCYNSLMQNNSLGILKNRLINFAKNNQVDLVGTFNPLEARLTRSQFNDPMHSNSSSVSSILQIKQYSVTTVQN